MQMLATIRKIVLQKIYSSSYNLLTVIYNLAKALE